MSKILNLNKNVIANKVKQSDEIATPYGLAMTGECGRSMVEMLGVLAVMGVLSVGGVAMYTSAMNKHRANELLNEASKRATILAMQVASGKTGSALSIGEFGNNTVNGVTFTVDTTYATGDKTFKLTLSSVEESVCEQMKSSIGEDGIMKIEGTCGSTLTLIFNADLTRGVTANSNQQSGQQQDKCANVNCTGCQTCNTSTGECEDNNNECSDGKECSNAECVCNGVMFCLYGEDKNCGENDFKCCPSGASSVLCVDSDGPETECLEKLCCPSGKYQEAEVGYSCFSGCTSGQEYQDPRGFHGCCSRTVYNVSSTTWGNGQMCSSPDLLDEDLSMYEFSLR